MLLALGLLLLSGVLAGQLCGRIGLPRVVGYVVAGILFSEELLGGTLDLRIDTWSEPVAAGTLGIVAYLIGGAITPGQIRRIGGVVFAVALGGTLVPFVLVFLGLWGFGFELEGVGGRHLGLALGAIAATTAPAATVAVIHQYRAKGPFTSVLLGVVAIDDAIGLMIYSLVLALGFGGSFSTTLQSAGHEIIGGLCLGAVGGYFLVEIHRWIRPNGLRQTLILGSVLLVIGIAGRLGFSPLLTAMSMGFICRAAHGARGERLFAPVEQLEELVFILFFTLAGTHFLAGAFVTHLGLVGVYVVLRAIGKIVGASVCATVVGARMELRKWLGLGLLPQAGVAVGLALSLSHHPAFRPVATTLMNIVLASTVIHELIGPIATRFVLGKAGELGSKRTERRAR